MQTIKDSADNMGLRSSAGGGEDGGNRVKLQPVKVEHKTGRNEPCPCGSGKKYKNCHGKDA